MALRQIGSSTQHFLFCFNVFASQKIVPKPDFPPFGLKLFLKVTAFLICAVLLLVIFIHVPFIALSGSLDLILV